MNHNSTKTEFQLAVERHAAIVAREAETGEAYVPPKTATEQAIERYAAEVCAPRQTCSKCGEAKPRTARNFQRQARSARNQGFRPACKACEHEGDVFRTLRAKARKRGWALERCAPGAGLFGYQILRPARAGRAPAVRGFVTLAEAKLYLQAPPPADAPKRRRPRVAAAQASVAVTFGI